MKTDGLSFIVEKINPVILSNNIINYYEFQSHNPLHPF